MTNHKITPDFDLEQNLILLKETAAKSIDPCTTATYIALSNIHVQELIQKKLQEKNVFLGIRCLDRLSIPENKYVYFDFDCKPGTICLIKPAFVAIINIVDGYVVSIVDPYNPESSIVMDMLTVKGLGDTSLDIDISFRRDGNSICAKVKVKIEVEGLGSGELPLPEVCLGEEGLCSKVDSGGGDLRAEAEVCWHGSEICASVTAKIKLFGKWYEVSDNKCVGISR